MGRTEVFEEVVFRGSPEDVIWRSEVTILSKNAKIYSRERKKNGCNFSSFSFEL